MSRIGAQGTVEAGGDEAVGTEAGEPEQRQAITQKGGDQDEIDGNAQGLWNTQPDRQPRRQQNRGNQDCREKMRPVGAFDTLALAGEIAEGEIGERRNEARHHRQDAEDLRHAVTPAQPDQQALHDIHDDQREEEAMRAPGLTSVAQQAHEEDGEKQGDEEGERDKEHARLVSMAGDLRVMPRP